MFHELPWARLISHVGVFNVLAEFERNDQRITPCLLCWVEAAKTFLTWEYTTQSPDWSLHFDIFSFFLLAKVFLGSGGSIRQHSATSHQFRCICNFQKVSLHLLPCTVSQSRVSTLVFSKDRNWQPQYSLPARARRVSGKQGRMPEFLWTLIDAIVWKRENVFFVLPIEFHVVHFLFLSNYVSGTVWVCLKEQFSIKDEPWNISLLIFWLISGCYSPKRTILG